MNDTHRVTVSAICFTLACLLYRVFPTIRYTPEWPWESTNFYLLPVLLLSLLALFAAMAFIWGVNRWTAAICATVTGTFTVAALMNIAW